METDSIEKIHQSLGGEILHSSLTCPLVTFGSHPIIRGFTVAYNEHRPITISPDIIWLLICQGFSHHVNYNAEQLRCKFVNFEEKRWIRIEATPGSDKSQFEELIIKSVDEIQNYVGEELVQILTANFTTTTGSSLIASKISILNSMKQYFKYYYGFHRCGIPSITLEGTVEDWQSILIRLDYLENFDLKWWQTN